MSPNQNIINIMESLKIPMVYYKAVQVLMWERQRDVIDDEQLDRILNTFK